MQKGTVPTSHRWGFRVRAEDQKARKRISFPLQQALVNVRFDELREGDRSALRVTDSPRAQRRPRSARVLTPESVCALYQPSG